VRAAQKYRRRTDPRNSCNACTKMDYHSCIMTARHALLRLLLAFILLASQQIAFAHSMSHLGSHGEASGKQLPADQFCDQCLSAAQLASGATSNLTPVPSDAGASPAPVPHRTLAFLPGTACVFQSRAPPLA
jgi:hypothetical protein